jgi:hypothetical protein
MKVRHILNESLDKRATFNILHEFVKYAAESLELKTLPKFHFIFDSNTSVERKSFGGYAPGERHIDVTVKNRHIMDVCRTLAHEMVHFKQDLNDQLVDENAGATGSPQENEANAEAAVIMRNWGKEHPDLFEQDAIG